MAIVAAGALVLTGCTPATDDPNGDEPTTTQDGTGAGDGSDSTQEPDANGERDTAPYDALEAPAPGAENYTGRPDLGSVTTAEGNVSYSVGTEEYLGYNGSISATAALSTSVINGLVRGSFWYFGTDGAVYPDTAFGSYERISDDPLIVQYTISDSAVWEDGTPITYNDFVVDWATRNPAAIWEPAPPAEDEEPPAEGTVPGDGPFEHLGTSYGWLVPEGPQGARDGKTFTIEYSSPYPDWKLTVAGAYPAHVLAEQSGLSVEELVEAVETRDAETVEQIADFWNTGWIFEDRALPDAGLIPASGPYTLNGGQWVPGEFVQVVANPQWWGPAAATESITIRFSDPDTHVQALANRDLHVIEPPATLDTIGSLSTLGDSVQVSIQDVTTFEHLDFQFADASPFAEANGGLAAREAFAYCVPRDTIVESLIQPINPDAVTMDVREQYPFQPGYEELVNAAYDGRYDTADLDLAREKFAESGLEEDTEIRIAYNANNPRRASTVQIIKQSCDQVGFEIVDGGSEEFNELLVGGEWEIALFAWTGSGLVTESRRWYHSTGSANYGGYSSAQVDAAWETIQSSSDSTVHSEQFQIIDKAAWDDLHSIVLYAHPGVVAHDPMLNGVIPTATRARAIWNAEQWRFD